MRTVVGSKVVLARLGGDEFAAMVDASVGEARVVEVASLRTQCRFISSRWRSRCSEASFPHS